MFSLLLFFVFFYFVIKATSRINLERWKVCVKLTEPADLKGKCEGEIFRKTLFANIVWFVSCKGRRKQKKNNLSLKTSVQWGGLENGDLFVFVRGFGGRLGPPAYYTREIWKQSNLWWKKKMGCTLEGKLICCITNPFSSCFVIKTTSWINLEKWKVCVRLTEPADFNGKFEGK